MTARMTAACCMSLVMLLVLCAGVHAQIPALLNYQVMLTDDADNPLADQTVTMVFTLYDAESGGTALWTETQTPTTNSIGVVSVLLGSISPITFDFDAPYWLDVEVNGQVLSPRRPLTAAPYAGRAADTDRLGGTDASEYALLADIGALGDGHSLDAVDGSPVDALHVDADGNVIVGGEAADVALNIGGSSEWSAAASLQSSTEGGLITLLTHNGYDRVKLVAYDHTGSLTLRGPGTFEDPYISMVASDYGTNEPRFTIEGSTRSVRMNMAASGNNSVALPGSAIGSHEMADEPGVASVQAEGWYPLSTMNATSVAARTMTTPAPSDGYVFVMATAQLRFVNDTPQTHRAVFGVSESQTAFSGAAQETQIQMQAGLPAGDYDHSVAVSGLFEISAGETPTYYLIAFEDDGDCSVRARQLTLMYFPTEYGPVDTTD